MGVFGFSFIEKINSAMAKSMVGLPERKIIWKAFSSQGNKNVESMYREYAALQASGYQPANIAGANLDSSTNNIARVIAKRLGFPLVIPVHFLFNLVKLGQTGKIPYKKWKPVQFALSKKQQKGLAANKNIFTSALKTTANISKFAMLGALALGGAYVYNAFKKGK